MPIFKKFVCRWILGTTAATMLLMAALPSPGHAQELTICVSPSGKVRGVNVECNSQQTQVGPFETVGPQGPQGPQGVQGPAGFAGAQGAAGGPGIQGAPGAEGPVGPTGDPGAAGAVGLAGPDGPQGNPGIQGIQGIPGNQGTPGTNGTDGGNEGQITFLTGGSLGTLGKDTGIALGAAPVVSSNAPKPVGFAIFLGPGNGAANDPSAAVPMNNPGAAFNLFVNVDTNPGTDPITGAPISYVFILEDLSTEVNGPFCVITDPDTTCADLVDNVFYNQGDLMVLFAFVEDDDPFANIADVKWSVDYQLIVG
jgi:Collagen triple helix repeat (20 copies)